ncbi:putative c2 domain containing protein [Erysiphe neolycopersici]|uniref:Putative c2 domain containing protein n=1 Tax=Erysiphe neolycopersici TaxID=212602 RepID=A0A420I3V6_9PEZI|nr:putative c2 domain containing protein [Erysiphe neolycopersici]
MPDKAQSEWHENPERTEVHNDTYDEYRYYRDTCRSGDKYYLNPTVDDCQPAGGYDATPIPSAPDGYTIKFTIHRARNLPRSDLTTKFSDPYIVATLTADLPKRHKSDPEMVLRTPTIHNSLNPEWETQWIVAGIPSTGFKLKCRIYDEDQANHDDRLGNVTLTIDRVKTGWPGIKYKSFTIKKRMASKRAYVIHGCSAFVDQNTNFDGFLYLSAELIGKSEKPHGRMYTLGLTSYFKHYSPLIGVLTGTKVPKEIQTGGKHQIEKYDFQANQFQLEGPVPAELYHRFVEFKPFVKGLFDKTGIRGRVLNTVLHHQHRRIYNYSSSTEYGVVSPCSEEASMQFLKMAHFDDGWRTFTYVLTLDGLLRFTETGKEFGIDLLSKHTMHSDVSVYIACSGEFLIRRRHHQEDRGIDPHLSHIDRDIKHYTLIIDNDSGTYRPNGDLLPLLKKLLNKNFPGLDIQIKECTNEAHIKMKQEQRDRKKLEGYHVQMVQDSDGEIDSSDEENLAKRYCGRKGKKERIYAAMEDPKKAIKELIDKGL